MKPFDLEKALQGELVVLRNGELAQLLNDISVQGVVNLDTTNFNSSNIAIGVLWTGEAWQWYRNGVCHRSVESEFDIVGMYEKPKPTFDYWHCLDDKWKYIAYDKSGNRYAYANKPMMLPTLWSSESEYLKISNVFKDDLQLNLVEDWADSLIERPEGV